MYLPGLGLFDVNRPVSNQMGWASLLVNTSNALVFTSPLKVWNLFMTNMEKNDWVEIVVPVKPGGKVKPVACLVMHLCLYALVS